MSGPGKCGCKGENKAAIEGKVPPTIDFKCPGGDNCSCCPPKKKPDKNNNECMCGEEPEKKEEECKEEEKKEPPPPEIRMMPKAECTACGQQKKDPTVDKCGNDKPPKNIEDNPPPICTKLPETQTFKGCVEDDEPPKNESGEKRASTTCKACGAPVTGPKCDCGKPLPPIPAKPPCGCNKGGPCGPNTSCEVQPLSFKKKK